MLNELIVECVIGFGRLMRILEKPMEIVERGSLFSNVEQTRVVCRLEDVFFKRLIMYIEFDYKVSHIFGRITLESITQVIAIYAKLASGYGSNSLLGDVKCG
jgi:hypothetical protein